MSKFRFLIANLENAAFSDGERDAEVARLLRLTADKLDNGQQCGNLKDYNGNMVGDFGFYIEGTLP